MRKSAILTLLWLMASVPIAGAGPAPTVLSGTVLNSRGVPVAGARVFWQASDGRAPHTLHTDANGKFRARCHAKGGTTCARRLRKLVGVGTQRNRAAWPAG